MEEDDEGGGGGGGGEGRARASASTETLRHVTRTALFALARDEKHQNIRNTNLFCKISQKGFVFFIKFWCFGNKLFQN